MSDNRVACLDGLRGLAALWVVLSHALLFTGYSIPIVQSGSYGVDLFMLLSGFLMVFQYRVRSKSEDWSKPAVCCAFLARRFFRLSPLYFTLLAVALMFGPMLYLCRLTITQHTGLSHDADRYLDASFTNIALHATYVFGLLPQYSFRSPLPDWSLGLEMQFYFAFPFLMWLVRRLGWPVASGVALMAAVGVAVALDLGEISYPQPTLLPLKLNVFLAGMLCASGGEGGDRPNLILAGGILLIAILPLYEPLRLEPVVVQGGITMILITLTRPDLLGHVAVSFARLGTKILGSPMFHWMGELSYGVYLLHLLIFTPMAAFVLKWIPFASTPMLKFLFLVAISLPITYILSYVTYFLLEIPGQRLGRWVIKHTLQRQVAKDSTAAEVIAVP